MGKQTKQTKKTTSAAQAKMEQKLNKRERTVARTLAGGQRGTGRGA